MKYLVGILLFRPATQATSAQGTDHMVRVCLRYSQARLCPELQGLSTSLYHPNCFRNPCINVLVADNFHCIGKQKSIAPYFVCHKFKYPLIQQLINKKSYIQPIVFFFKLCINFMSKLTTWKIKINNMKNVLEVHPTLPIGYSLTNMLQYMLLFTAKYMYTIHGKSPSKVKLFFVENIEVSHRKLWNNRKKFTFYF